jgi:hypothetical protein
MGSDWQLGITARANDSVAFHSESSIVLAVVLVGG